MSDIPCVYWQALAIAASLCLALVFGEINRSKRP